MTRTFASEEERDAYYKRLYDTSLVAINNGADIVKVNTKLKSFLQKQGLDAVLYVGADNQDDPELSSKLDNIWYPEKAEQRTKQFDSMTQADYSPKLANSPLASNAPVDDGGFWSQAGEGVRRGLVNAGRTGLLAASSLARTIPGVGELAQQELLGRVQDAGQYLEDTRAPAPTSALGKAGAVTGGLVTGLGTMGVGELGTNAVETLDRGGSLTKAYQSLGVDSAQAMLGVASGLGGIGYAQKAAQQIAANVALDVGGQALHNEIAPERRQDLFDPTRLAIAVGAGAVGGLGKSVAEQRVHLRDADILRNAELEAARAAELDAQAQATTADESALSKQLATDTSAKAGQFELGTFQGNRPRELEQGDLFSPEPTLSVDMFSGETVPGSELQRRYAQAAVANDPRAEALLGDTVMQRTQEEQAALEQDYLFSQNERVNAPTEVPIEPAPMRLGSVEDGGQPDLWNVGISRDTAVPTKALQVDAEGNPVAYTETAPNSAMAQAMDVAQVRRGVDNQLENLFPDTRVNTSGEDLGTVLQAPETNQVFNPSRVPTVEQTQVQPELELPTTQDLFGSPEVTAPRTNSPEVSTRTTEATTPITETRTAADTDARAKLAARLGLDTSTPAVATQAADEGTNITTRAGLPDVSVPYEVRALAQRGGAVPEVTRAQELASGEVSAGARATQANINFFKDERKKYTGSTRSVIEDAALNPDPAVRAKAMSTLESTLPDTAARIKTIRADAKINSREIAKNILLDPNSTTADINYANKTLDQEDFYAPKAYKAFTEAGYMENKLKSVDQGLAKKAEGKPLTDKEVQDVAHYNGAIDHIIQTKILRNDGEMRSKAVRDFGPTADERVAARSILLAQAGLDNVPKGAMRRFFNGLASTPEVKANLTEFPEPLQKFFGEITDPVARISMIDMAQRTQLAHIKGMNEFTGRGLETGLLENVKPSDPKKADWVQLQGPGYGALGNKWMSPDTRAAVRSLESVGGHMANSVDLAVHDAASLDTALSLLKNVGKTAAKGINMFKMVDVMSMPGKWAWSYAGNPAVLMSNGNVNPVTWGKGWKEAAKLAVTDFSKVSDPETNRLIRLNVVEHSSLSHQFDPKYRAEMKNLLGDSSAWEDGTQVAKKITRMIPKGYGLPDNAGKLSNFYNEEAFFQGKLKRQNPNMSDAEIKSRAEELAANRVNDTNITPSRAPKLIAAAEAVSLTRFARYMTETAYVVKNNLATGLSDVREGLATGDKLTTLHGLKRLAGVGSAGAVYSQVIPAAVGALYGAAGLAMEKVVPGSEEDKYAKSDDFLRSGDNYKITDSKGKDYIQDMGTFYPFDPANKFAKAAMDIVALQYKMQSDTTGKNFKPELDDALQTLKVDALGLLPMGRAGSELVKDSTRTPTLAKTSPSFYADALKTGQSARLDTNDVNRIFNYFNAISSLGGNISRGLDNADRGDKAATALTTSGIGLSKLDPTEDVQNYLAGSWKIEQSKAKDTYMKTLKSPIDVDPEVLDRKFTKAMEQIVRPYEKMQAAINLAIKQNKGTDKIENQLKLSGVSDEIVGALLDKQPIPIDMVVGDLNAQANKEIDQAYAKSEEEGQRVEELWSRKHSQLDALLNKYADVTIQDLKTGAYKK